MANGNDPHVTRSELRKELSRFPTKADLRKELRRFATKDALAKVDAVTRRNSKAIAENSKAIAENSKAIAENTNAIGGNTGSISLLASEVNKIHSRLDRIESNMATKDQLSNYVSAVDKFASDNDVIWKKHLVHDERIGALEKSSDHHEGRITALEKGRGA